MSVDGIEHCYTTPKLPSPSFLSIKYLPAIIEELLDLGLKYLSSSAIEIVELYGFLISCEFSSLTKFFFSNLINHFLILYWMAD
jgi:hypothetical protein